MQQYQFKSNKYSACYQRLMTKATLESRIKSDTVYYERHHIIPKSLGGSNAKINLVLLTPREHFIAHLLLVRMVKDEDVYRMVNAICRFKKKATNAGEFSLLRSTISRYSKGHLNPSFNKIWIHNVKTKDIHYVDKNEFDAMPQDIFKKGLPYQRGGHKGTIWVNNGIDQSCIEPNKLNEFVSNGWVKGRLNMPGNDHMKHMSSKRHTREKDIEHSLKLNGRIAIKHPINGDVKRIHPRNLSQYENLGYVNGIDFSRPLPYKIMIEGTIYRSLRDASDSYKIPKSTISYRLNSDLEKWKNWVKLDP